MQVGNVLIDRYELVAKVGEGGMGVVYRANDREGGVVAVKRLHADVAATPGLITRFEREAAASALLSHPNIAALHAVGSTPGGELFFVMELVEGESLAHTLARGPLPRAEALRLAKQILSALHHAHQFGMVHRDLKPDNVLLDRSSGRPAAKLIDFGLVKMLQNVLGAAECERLTATGMVFGTPGYMPPEQILGHEVDARTDLYSMGVMLYEMLTGKLPFDSEEIPVLWNMHLHAPPPTLAEGNPAVASADLDAVIHTLMAKVPAGRFDSALAVIRALDSSM
ncbi:MAG TPA: serine/threonine-protein kinase [Nannocystaceae bacterium]|nr:serine/threonine-protein kinase [Nannocystaceae bacterium]